MASLPPATNPSPKQRFIETAAHVHNHREMLQSAPFEYGTDMAFLQYATEIANEVRDQTSALSVGFRLAGAAQYLNSIKTLSEKPPLPPPRPTDNLTHLP